MLNPTPIATKCANAEGLSPLAVRPVMRRPASKKQVAAPKGRIAISSGEDPFVRAFAATPPALTPLDARSSASLIGGQIHKRWSWRKAPDSALI